MASESEGLSRYHARRMLSIDWLPDDHVQRIAAHVDAIARGAGEKLRAVLLVGACVPPVRAIAADCAELLVVVEDLPVPALTNLAHQVSQVGGDARDVCVHVVTERELLRSTDVFTLELADYERHHRLLLGADPLVDLYYTPASLRVALERRLRFLSRSVRAGMMTGVWTDGRLDEARRLFVDGVLKLLVVADHMLRLEGGEPPRQDGPLLEALAKHCDVELGQLVVRVTRMANGEPLDRPMDALGELLTVVDAATLVVDAMGVG
jgi:hypothetical protein